MNQPPCSPFTPLKKKQEDPFLPTKTSVSSSSSSQFKEKTTGTYWIHLYKLLNKKKLIPSMELTYPSKSCLESHTTLDLRWASAPHKENVEPNLAPARCVSIGRQTKIHEFKGKKKWKLQPWKKNTCGTNKNTKKHQRTNHLIKKLHVWVEDVNFAGCIIYVCIKFHLPHHRKRQFTWSF